MLPENRNGMLYTQFIERELLTEGLEEFAPVTQYDTDTRHPATPNTH